MVTSAHVRFRLPLRLTNLARENRRLPWRADGRMEGGVMKHLFSRVAVFAALLLVPQLAHAQDQAKVFVRPLVGANVGAGPGAVFAATFVMKANKISQKTQLLAEFGRMENIMPSSIADQVDVTAAKV